MSEAIKIALVVAVAHNNVIGANGGLAWKISDDLKWFKKSTLGKPIVMGRKTFDSIGRALPGRDNIVVTRDHGFQAAGIFKTYNINSALSLALFCAQKQGAGELCIIGGAQIYRQLLVQAHRIYLTRVDADIDGDAYFPALDSGEWAQQEAGTSHKNEKNQYDCEYFILDRRSR